MKWIIVVAFFALTGCSKPKAWECYTSKGMYKVHNATPAEISKMERENAEVKMHCH